MYDILGAVIFMSIVAGLAAGILWMVDRWTLPGKSSAEERVAAVNRRKVRLVRFWRILFAGMAIISLPLNWFALITKKEPMFPTIIWIVVATLFLLGWLRPSKEDEKG